MTEKNPLDSFADMIAEILQLAQQIEKKTVSSDELPKDTQEVLTKLKMDVDKFCELSHVIAETEEQKLPDPTLELNPREKRSMERINQMHDDALELQCRLVAAVKKSSGSASEDGKKEPGLKSKLKGIGSRKNWKRM